VTSAEPELFGRQRLESDYLGVYTDQQSAAAQLARAPAPGTGVCVRGVRVGVGVRLAPRLAAVVVATVLCGYCVVGLLQVVLSDLPVFDIVLAAVLVLALLTAQLFYFGNPSRPLRTRLTAGVLVVQALLVGLPLLEFGQAWVGLPSFFFGSLLLVLPPWPARVVFVASGGVMALVQAALNDSVLDIVYTTIGTLVFALAVYGLTRLSRLIGVLDATRTELARIAVSEERLRFARDLHDLLGLGLSAITLKAELANRLLASRPERSARELDEVLMISRRALGDVRTVAFGYAELSLQSECAEAEATLALAGLDVRLERDDGQFPERIRSVLATVLREAVTNVLRHSKAEQCTIALRPLAGQAVLTVVNDGVTEPSGEDVSRAGSGLDNIAHRVASLGGELSTKVEDGTFLLRAAVPLDAVTADPEPGGEEAGPAATAGTAGEEPRQLIRLALVLMFLAASVHLLYLTTDPVLLAIGIGCAAAVLVVHLVGFTGMAPPPPVRGRVLLALEVLLVYLPLPFLGAAWVSTPGFLCGATLLVLRPAAAWTAFVAGVLSVGVAQELATGSEVDLVFNVVATVISGLVVFALTYLARLVDELGVARKRLAGLVVAEERLRFARHLHDLLGLALSAITLKGELIRRLLATNPADGRVGVGFTEVVELSRKALTDMRSVARGYRGVPGDLEHDRAMASLTVADTLLRADAVVGALPVHVRQVLAIVVHGVAAGVRADHHLEIGVPAVADGHQVEITGWFDPAPVREAPLVDRVAELGARLTVSSQQGGPTRITVLVAAAAAQD
jgi:signal transduction histidine kinase